MSCCGARVIVEPTPSGTGDVTTSNLVSTVNGLGTAGYISSLSGDATTGQLTSTTTGIYNYVSSFIFPSELTSSLQGLATMGYISSSQLISTVAGLGAGGGGDVTLSNLTSTVQGLGTAGYISSSQLISTVAGLGAGITDANLTSTVQGLGTAGYISSSQLISTVAGLGVGITDANLTSTVQGLGTAGYLSSITFPTYSLSTTSEYNKISLKSGDNIISDVDIPYAFEVDIYRTNTVHNTKGTNLNIIEENIDNQDSNVTKVLGFQYIYDYPPKVWITPYSPHSLSNALIPCIRDVTTSYVTYEIYDVTTMSFTTDPSFVRVLGTFTDTPQTAVFTHNDAYLPQQNGFANLQIGSFVTPANLDPDIPLTIFLSNTFEYTAGSGSVYLYYINSVSTSVATPETGATAYLANYPPAAPGFVTYSSTSNTPTTIFLQPNHTYYTFFYQPYLTSFSNVIAEISITYTTNTV